MFSKMSSNFRWCRFSYSTHNIWKSPDFLWAAVNVLLPPFLLSVFEHWCCKTGEDSCEEFNRESKIQACKQGKTRNSLIPSQWDAGFHTSPVKQGSVMFNGDSGRQTPSLWMPSTSFPLSPALCAEDDAIWWEIFLGSVKVSCRGCVPSQIFRHLQTPLVGWCEERLWLCVSTAQQWLRNPWIINCLQKKIQTTAPHQLLWRKWSLSQPKAGQFQRTLLLGINSKPLEKLSRMKCLRCFK